MKQKIRALGVIKKGEGVIKFLDDGLNLREVRFEKGAEPEFDIVKHPTIEVVSVDPLELRHRIS
jgi:hypothetical protein